MKRTKKNGIFLSRAVLVFFLICTVVPITLLLVEYRQLQKATQELLDLKNDYRSYAMTLKRLIRENSREVLASTESDVKKKSIALMFPKGTPIVSSDVALDESFFTVNRDPIHLRKSALAFAKKHKLQAKLEKIFQEERLLEELSSKQFPVKKKKKKRRSTVSGMAFRPRTLPDGTIAKRDFVFSWPVDKDKFWISSRFGPRKMGKHKWKFHYGLDMAALKGTIVRSAAAGIVIQSEWHKGYGNCITIVHNRKYKTRYAHLHTRAVKVGQKVKRGGIIGRVGATGFVKKVGKDASHLHFEVYSFGRHINPISVLA